MGWVLDDCYGQEDSSHDGKNITKIADSSMNIVHINNFWLIAGTHGRLLKYNGTFEDLTGELSNPKPWPIPGLNDFTPLNSTEPQGRKGICGPGVLMLLSLFPLMKMRT
ncbi:hypothetical protein DRN43_02480 [Thermococci archaeon]|nr:MAG: hypothetical protein DRN43_02480 [Thermococci archaeon]